MRWVSIAFSVCFLMLAPAIRAEVPLRWDVTGHVVVPTLINGTGPASFALDTGADETGVFSWLAKQLKLPTAGTTELSGATGVGRQPARPIRWGQTRRCKRLGNTPTNVFSQEQIRGCLCATRKWSL
jgi:hypothetical protein